MSTVLTVLHVVVCLSLIAIILLQAGRGQGLTGASFGSGNVQSLFGTRAGDFLSKATTVAAICFLLTSIGLDLLEVRKSRSLLNFSNQDSTLDMDAIKKALENVKSEAGDNAPTTETVEDLKSQIDETASDVETRAAEAEAEVVEAAAAVMPSSVTETPAS